MIVRTFVVLLTMSLALGASARAQDPAKAILDLKGWAQQGLPAAAEWNVVGFSPTWHVNQIRAAHRLLPSVFLPQVDLPVGQSANDAAYVTNLLNYPADFAYLQANGLPLCLRTNNICFSIGKSSRFRAPLVAASIPPSPLVWRIYNGALDDTPILDSLGPVANWNREGTDWGKSQYMQKLQTLVTAPPYVVLVENNEWPYETGPYYTATKNATTGVTTYAFRTPSEIAALSVRMRDRVAALSASSNVSPRALDTEIALQRRTHFAALFSSFNAALVPGWKDKLLTAAYKANLNLGRPDSTIDVDQVGYAPQAICYDAGSPAIYITRGTSVSNFTSLQHTNILSTIPAWEWLRAKNPRAYRECSLTIDSDGALAGALAGKHEVITPARYQGWIQWLLWSIHDPKVPVLLRHWCRSTTLPTDPFFPATQFANLDKYGAGAVKNARVEDYVLSILASVDRVCTNATLRNYWLNGAPIIAPGKTPTQIVLEKLGSPPYPRDGEVSRAWRVLEVNVNQTPSQWVWNASTSDMSGTIKVWAVATRIGDQALLYAWSPCKLTGNVTVKIPDIGTVTIAAPQPWGYWLVNKGAAAIPLPVAN